VIHVLDKEWSILGIPMAINCQEIYSLLKYEGAVPQLISIKDIGHKPIDLIDKEDIRYLNANLNLPAIVVRGMQNPLNKPYRMIDGRHRILKAKENKIPELLTYVIDEKRALKHMQQYI
jgi:hypothetical protein